MRKIAILIILFPLRIFAQDFSGVWTGYLSTSGNQLSYELVVSQTGDKLTGYSLSVFTFNGVENIGIKSMKIKGRKGGISIEDDDLIYDNYTTKAKRVTLFSTLNLEREDSILILQGTFFTRSLDRSSFKGTIRLQKIDNFSATRVMPHLEKMNLHHNLSFVQSNMIRRENESLHASVTYTKALPDSGAPETEEIKTTAIKKDRGLQPVSIAEKRKEMPAALAPPVIKAAPKVVPRLVAAEIDSRKTEVIRTVFFQSDSLVLSLYDNGQVDGDTVSVVVNNKIMVARQGLTTTANTTTLYINDFAGDSLRLVMYAENLGTIPPNTGLLIIQDGNERYQIRFEGDLQKNSAVILRRKK